MNQEQILKKLGKADLSIQEIISLAGCNSCGCGGTGSGAPICGGLYRLSPASCPSTIAQGTVKDITVTVTSPGTPPYTYKVKCDGDVVAGPYTGSETSHTFPGVVFNQSMAAHTYQAEVVDSCGTGVKTATDQCTVTIVAACIQPAVNLIIP